MNNTELIVKNKSQIKKATMVGCRSNGNVVFAEEQIIQPGGMVSFQNLPDNEFEIAVSIDNDISDGENFVNDSKLKNVIVEIFDGKIDFTRETTGSPQTPTVEQTTPRGEVNNQHASTNPNRSQTANQHRGQPPAHNQGQGQPQTANQHRGQPPAHNQGQGQSGNQKQTLTADEQYCHSCGAVIKNQASICPNCGVSTENSANLSGSGDLPEGRKRELQKVARKNTTTILLVGFLFPTAGYVLVDEIGWAALCFLSSHYLFIGWLIAPFHAKSFVTKAQQELEAHGETW